MQSSYRCEQFLFAHQRLLYRLTGCDCIAGQLGSRLGTRAGGTRAGGTRARHGPSYGTGVPSQAEASQASRAGRSRRLERTRETREVHAVFIIGRSASAAPKAVRAAHLRLRSFSSRRSPMPLCFVSVHDALNPTLASTLRFTVRLPY